MVDKSSRILSKDNLTDAFGVLKSARKDYGESYTQFIDSLAEVTTAELDAGFQEIETYIVERMKNGEMNQSSIENFIQLGLISDTKVIEMEKNDE